MRASRLVLSAILILSLPAAAAVLPATVAGTPADGQGAPVNINTADASQLQQLKGVGPSKAAAIISWRRGHGAFRRVEDLDEVKGIGPSLIARNRARILVK